MKRLLIVLTVLAFLSTGCSSAKSDARPQIVVTTNILGDVVRNLVGEQAEVVVLMKPNADPHSFEISAQEARLLHDAPLVVSNGLGLEEGLQHNLDESIAAGAAQFVAGDVIDVLAYAGDEGRTGADDPHFWTDPARMIDVVDALEPVLTATVGLPEGPIADNVSSYRDQLVALDAEMTEKFAAISTERRALVTNHHVFGYLADRFDFRVVGTIIPSGTTLAAPSAADLRELTSAIHGSGVRTIFAESSQPDRLAQVLASEAGLDIEVRELFTESLTEPGGGADTYLTMMRVNTDRIAQGLTR
ncbi:zinc ABC transporter substrate-binding protein AztC [Microbacterium nymphoidis]|uniref:zinc ABC transporter substrate-binding protein AztC n=1 Tax=Microbacterium nymphoidis TaxID=2898586 RepID=UPI001E33D18F|nr:zinc ABC transporter substrate-binding protein AztC [Microbacterium nymphoidis]MCD2497023.1 metal ABC transporter substrate-binding protein [Microbacterium nymphoidis]